MDELHKRSWCVTLFAERFDDERRWSADSGRQAVARATSNNPTGKADGWNSGFIERVRLEAYFHRDITAWLGRALEIYRLWKRITSTPGALVIVQGDLPRLGYALLQSQVPLLFIRQDGILTCPGNNRFLGHSRAVCRRAPGLACLRVHRHEECLSALSFPRQVGRIALRLRDRLLLRQLRHFVVSSQYLLAAHQRAGVVLYPPNLRAGADAGSRRDLRRLVFCGRLEAVKGPLDAIRILSLLPDAFTLEILGEGPERGRLGQAVQALQMAHRVRFRGWVDAMARDACLASSGVLLMPSRWSEAFGMAGLEALTQGTPAVAYDVGGISEWCHGGAGRLVPCGDIRRAAQAVQELTGDPDNWLVYSRAAKRVARLEFPEARFGHELEAIVRRLREST